MKLININRGADANNSNGGTQANDPKAGGAKTATAKQAAANASDALLNADKADTASGATDTGANGMGENTASEATPGDENGGESTNENGDENQGAATGDQQENAENKEVPAGPAANEKLAENENQGSSESGTQANDPDDDVEERNDEREKKFAEEQDKALNHVAEKIAGHLQNAGIGVQSANKPAGPHVLTDEEKVKKFGPGYVDAKNANGAQTTFSARVWASLGKNKLGWQPIVKTPPEVDALNKTN